MDLPPGGDAILFVLPQSRWHYAVPCTIHSLNSQPIFMAIMLTLTLIAIGLCFFYHSWLPTFLVIEIAVLFFLAYCEPVVLWLPRLAGY